MEQNSTNFAFSEPKCEKWAKSAKRTTFEHLGSLLSPSPPARPGQLWETSGRRSPDVSQTSLSLGLSGWLPQAGGERGRVGGCPPPTSITVGGLFGMVSGDLGSTFVMWQGGGASFAGDERRRGAARRRSPPPPLLSPQVGYLYNDYLIPAIRSKS